MGEGSMRVGRRLVIMAPVIAGVVALTESPALADYYNTYSDIADTPDTNGCTGVQGFAAGSTYLYSIKNRTATDDLAVIYRVNKTTGDRVLMTNGTSGGVTNPWLGHGNDMTIVDIDGAHHLFVVTMNEDGVQLVRLLYEGSTYYFAGSYAVRLNGAMLAPSGISRVSVSSTTITFMFKSGRTVYNGSLPLRADSGTIDLTKAFTLQVEGALVNGATVPDLDTFSNQGFYYDAGNKVLYSPLTKGNRSIVLVYRDVSPATTGTAPAASDLSFRVTSSVYDFFEIEGVGISDGKLYFSTNRSNDSGANDGVHVFKDYVAA
jgi:hypothetical protein